ncbi:MAG: Prochlorococcus phage, partial [Actinomycetota bacterium]
MISFNNLGNLGRLANQMFQYASIKGIAKNRGYEFCIPPKESFGINDLLVRGSDTTLYDCFNLTDVNKDIIINPIVQESGFHFDENIFNN